MTPARAAPSLRLSGLDGLRAVAALLVLSFHSNLAHTPAGGFLGVDLFFVISGFLITTLLLREWQSRHDIALGDFYHRRLRRLTPVVLCAVIGCVVASETVAPDALASLKKDVWFALTYTTNVWEIVNQRSYFELSGREPLLQHLWSLSIEEQFYLLWPALVWWALKHRALNGLKAMAIVLAVLSTSQLVHLSTLYGYPLEADPTRAYFGSDSHTMGLMVGSWLALALHTPQGLIHVNRPLHWAANVLGIAAFAAFLTLCYALNPVSLFLYHGGFLTVAILAAILVMIAVHPASWLAWALEWKAVRYIGKRSYGLYVWHWPVFALLRPHIDVDWAPWVTHLARFAITWALTELSYRWIEQPIRATSPKKRNSSWTRRGALTAAALLALTAVSVGALTLTESPPRNPMASAVNEAVRAPTKDPALAAAHPEASATNNSARAALTEEPSASLGDDAEVGLIGDSVMLGAKSALQQHYPGLNVDAEVGRQAAAVIALLKHQKAQGTLPKRVVLHLGTNGYVTDTQLEEMLNLLADTHVVLINSCAPRRWVDDNNALLSVAASQHPNVKLIDWNAISTEHAEYFGSDRIHLTAKGIRAYVDALKPWLPKRAEVGAEGVGITAPTGVPVSATNHGAPGAPGAAGNTKPLETNPL